MNYSDTIGVETGFAFNCGEDDLIGFLHAGDRRCDIGVLTLVAGGPQYRGGVGRQLVNLGRFLASQGVWVMRFDHRGLGDSGGIFRGFLSVTEDLNAAVDAFMKRAPHLRGVILWGGCDAATAVLINAHKNPLVLGVVAGNPFVGVASTGAQNSIKKLLYQLKKRSFWARLSRVQYRPAEYARLIAEKISSSTRISPGRKQESSGDRKDTDLESELLLGLQTFNGKILFLMGDRFLTSDNFNMLVSSSEEWREAYAQPRYQRIDIKGGDQVFSTKTAQENMFIVARDWIWREFPESFDFNENPAPLGLSYGD